MRKSRRKRGEVTPNLQRVRENGAAVEINVCTEELLGEVAMEIEAFSAQIGLRIMHAVMEQEVQRTLGPWGRQTAYRHGSQPGYVIYGGRKVGMERPRVRGKGGGEIGLDYLSDLSEAGQDAGGGGAAADPPVFGPGLCRSDR